MLTYFNYEANYRMTIYMLTSYYCWNKCGLEIIVTLSCNTIIVSSSINQEIEALNRVVSFLALS